MIAKAVLKYARRTPRKVNLVLETIRGRNVDYAFMLLKTLKQGSKEEVSKTLKSAVSNAYEKGFTDSEKIFVSQAYATEGTTLKRFTPRAMGRATRKLKRLSHITIVLEELSLIHISEPTRPY